MFRRQKEGFVNLGDIYNQKDCSSKFQLFLTETVTAMEHLEEILNVSPLFKIEPALHCTNELFRADEISIVWVHPSLAVLFLCYISPLYQAKVCIWTSSTQSILSGSLEQFIEFVQDVSFENFVNEKNK